MSTLRDPAARGPEGLGAWGLGGLGVWGLGAWGPRIGPDDLICIDKEDALHFRWEEDIQEEDPPSCFQAEQTYPKVPSRHRGLS